jgi:isocitrate dehydrogenase kinase/phosphatase
MRKAMGSRTPVRAAEAAALIEDAWAGYIADFQALTRRARTRFGHRDWAGVQHDGAARLDLYTQAVQRAIAGLDVRLGGALHVRDTWTRLKTAFVERVESRLDAELAETFFNSITRRLLVTVGVDPGIEFVTTALDRPSSRHEDAPVTIAIQAADRLDRAVSVLLDSLADIAPFQDRTRDAVLVSQVLARAAGGHPILTLEFARAPFFRNKGAYLIGRVHTLASTVPVSIALVNTPGGIRTDAVLTETDHISVVFSFAHSYFFVETGNPAALVAFLRELMPRKPVSELYASIGHNKHGKTEFYRALLAHLDGADDRFEIAPGARGMVMVVFTLPGFDAVFKIIRDRFEPPKTATRQDVREKYRLVSRHDRAGRLVDAQEFEHLEFDRRRFAPELLDELQAKASDAVEITPEAVHFRHLYTERRLTPLDLYIRTAAPGLARSAVLDYGQALRELAASDVFPGDLLIKNFGVSRHGRVIFYDYDELCRLSECRFRRLPTPHNLDEELAAEPWFHVGEHDVFPEEFLTFIGLTGGLQHLFAREHGDLLRPEFWTAMQEEHAAGRLPDLWPYPAEARLKG